MTLQKTPLNAVHRELGARMVEFAGWDMPVQYRGTLQEHRTVRSSVGIFDVSHMGQIEITGPDALSVVQTLTCNDVSQISDGQAQYSAFLYPEGTFVDDIVLYRISATHIFICVNAANKDKDVQWVLQQANGNVEIQDNSNNYAQLAVQGPEAEKVLQSLTTVDLSSMKYYCFTQSIIEGFDTLISRTGYTGESGFELYLPPEAAIPIWQRVMQVGRSVEIEPAGLAARNTLRLEVRYPLYGNDINDKTTPLEAGLGWIVKLNKGDFIGRTSLLQQKKAGVTRRLVGFQMLDRGIARDHYPVLVDGFPVGEVASGSFAPSLKRNIGLVYLPVQYAQTGHIIQVEVRGKLLRAQVVKTPFYRKD